ncbi:MAG: hypothetical protein OHK0021_02500 [Bryobacter sp.]
MEIVPTVALPPTMLLTSQSTPLLDVLLMVAEKVLVVPPRTVVEVGLIFTDTGP